MRVVCNLCKLNVALFLLHTIPTDEIITEDFSPLRDLPLSMAKYTYKVQVILTSKVPYESKIMKIKFLVELNMEKAVEKYGKNKVKNFIFKKHPDSGKIHVVSMDLDMFLPYDLTHRHSPF